MNDCTFRSSPRPRGLRTLSPPPDILPGAIHSSGLHHAEKASVSPRHPDDETFGPGATIARYAREGAEVHLATATRGEAGMVGDPPLTDREHLGEVRTAELLARPGSWDREGALPRLPGRPPRRGAEGTAGGARVEVIRTVRPARPGGFGPEGCRGTRTTR